MAWTNVKTNELYRNYFKKVKKNKTKKQLASAIQRLNINFKS